jgi:hypothetical protein
VQLAVESYATDFNGRYPTRLDERFKSYFREGSYDGKITRQAPLNPYTGLAQWPVFKGPDFKSVKEARNRVWPANYAKRGTILYFPLHGKSYVLIGLDAKGRPIQQNGKAIVLSCE